MRKPALIFLALLGVAAAVYFACYHIATHDARRMMASNDDQAWLRAEFALNDTQALAIAKLQADYQPRCMEMCARIAESNARLETLLAASKTMTPELEAAVREASQTRADCNTATLAQALAISAHIPPEHAARYRALIASRILPGTLRHDTATHR